MLDIIPFTTRHTGINIASTIKSVLVEFNILKKTLALTTDNELTMLICEKTIAKELAYEFDNQSFQHYRCLAHILNLVVQQGIEIIDNKIIKIHKLIKKLKIHLKDVIDYENYVQQKIYNIINHNQILKPDRIVLTI